MYIKTRGNEKYPGSFESYNTILRESFALNFNVLTVKWKQQKVTRKRYNDGCFDALHNYGIVMSYKAFPYIIKDLGAERV